MQLGQVFACDGKAIKWSIEIKIEISTVHHSDCTMLYYKKVWFDWYYLDTF